MDECLERFVVYAKDISDRAYEIVTKKYNRVFQHLKKTIDRVEKKEKKFAKARFSTERVYKRRERLSNIEEDFRRYLRAIPVVGFNSQRYDINIIKGVLVKNLMEVDNKLEFVVKKMESLTCLQTPSFKFLDITNFIAPGYSYEKYLSAFGVHQSKGFFPYEWMDCLDKLKYRHLPSKECFYSKLRRAHISDEDYEVVATAWRVHNMKSVKDLLIWYNNLDVAPFLEAIENQSSVYKDRGIDMLKEALSLPGLAVVWLFSVIGSPPSLKQVVSQSDEKKTDGKDWQMLSLNLVQFIW